MYVFLDLKFVVSSKEVILVLESTPNDFSFYHPESY